MKPVLFFLSLIVLLGCKSDAVQMVCDDAEFCNFITAETFEKSGEVINAYLSGQKASLSNDEKLNDLKSWLECKPCVGSAEIICNSCIYTLPPQSELGVRFSVNGKDSLRTLDILMGNPLKFVAYH